MSVINLSPLEDRTCVCTGRVGTVDTLPVCASYTGNLMCSKLCVCHHEEPALVSGSVFEERTTAGNDVCCDPLYFDTGTFMVHAGYVCFGCVVRSGWTSESVDVSLVSADCSNSVGRYGDCF